MAALTNSEAVLLVHCNRVNQGYVHSIKVIARHNHLYSLRKIDGAGDIGGSEVELRTISLEERCMTAALVLGKNVDVCNELGMRGDGARLSENLATLNFLTLGAAA